MDEAQTKNQKKILEQKGKNRKGSASALAKGLLASTAVSSYATTNQVSAYTGNDVSRGILNG